MLQKYLLPTHHFTFINHAWTRAVGHPIDASIYHTSVSSLVDFRKPLCGTAPSVIPIKRGNNANSCRCAFLTLLVLFLSPCFLSLLTGADMSNFFFRVVRFGNVVKGSKIQRFWLTKLSITDALAMSADITESYSKSIIRDSHSHTAANITWHWLATDQQYSLVFIYWFIYLFLSGNSYLQQQALDISYHLLRWQILSPNGIEAQHLRHHSLQLLSPLLLSEPLHYASTQQLQTSALQIRQTQTPQSIADHQSQKTKPPQQVTTHTQKTQQSTTIIYTYALHQPTSTTKTTPPPFFTSTNPQARPQKITQLVSATTTLPKITQTIQITSNLYYTSTHPTSLPSPTKPTRPTPSSTGTHITGHLLRHSTTTLLAPLQTNHHSEAKSPPLPFNSIRHATTTMPSSTSTIHLSPYTTRHLHLQQPAAYFVPSTSPHHTKVIQPNIHTPHITIRLPANGLSHRPHADTSLSIQSSLNFRHHIHTTPTTRDPPLHEHSQLQTTTRNTHHSPTTSQLAGTTLATLPKPQHSTSYHPQIPTGPWWSPPAHLPPHLPKQEHLESGPHKTPRVITAPIDDLRGLQICTCNIPKRDHWIPIAWMYPAILQGYPGGGFHPHWLFLLGDLGSYNGCSPQDCGQSQSVS